jgi:ABC-type transporter Mla subunit MlaD
MKRILYTVAVIAVLIIIGFWAGLRRPRYDMQEVNAYFADVHGLREGAPVEIAGVQIGIVKSVKIRSGSTAEPVEVVMSLQTSYPLNIPSDTTVSIHQAGLLGESFAWLSIKDTHGLPVTSGAVLKSVTTDEIRPCNVLNKISEILVNGAQNASTQKEGTSQSNTPPKHSSRNH